MLYHLRLIHESVSFESSKWKDLNSNIPDVDSLYRNGDEDRDLVEVIRKDEIKEYYNEKVSQIIEEVEKVYKGVIS